MDLIVLTLSLIKTLSDASAADGFLKKISVERRNCSKRAISPFATMSKVINSITKIFNVFDKICSKSSAAELSYEGKG